jgi:hypothetical protein
MNVTRAVCLDFLLALMASFTLTLFVSAAQAQTCPSGVVPCFQGECSKLHRLRLGVAEKSVLTARGRDRRSLKNSKASI